MPEVATFFKEGGAAYGTPLPPEVRLAVRRRSGGFCEALTPRCRGLADHGPHHRRMRSQGGSHDPENLLDVCDPCHRYIHHHTAESYEAGWLLRTEAR